ncbi:MAG: allophanate hydrolase [Pseudomonadota bacterium]
MLDLEFDRATLHRAYASGLGPGAVVDVALNRVVAADDPGIFLHVAAAEALHAAAQALPPFDPAALPLWGLPVAVKDNIDVRLMPTTCACPAFAYLPDDDAPAVARLREAGAIIVGKTNLDQFATGLVGVRTPYPVPRNALDPAIVPGGSSSGSAVAVARGLVTLALGTDTAGSGRVPAALNGIVGLKPSLGAISTRGVVPACRTLDCVSVFAATVADAWSAYAVLARYDEGDPYARPRAASRAWTTMPTVMRIGVPNAASRRFFGDDLQAAAFASVMTKLEELGIDAVPIDFSPFYQTAALLYEGAWVAERYATVESFLKEHSEALHPTTATIIEPGRNLTAVEAFRGHYRLEELRRTVAIAIAGLDALMVPSIPRFVTVAEVLEDPIGPNSQLGTYTNFVNLLDLCGMTVPTAPRTDGRPGSVTLLARGGEDGRLLPLATRLSETSGADGHVDAAVARAGPDEVELAVVGAHMTGMALNGELAAVNARLLRTARTKPSYRLYALCGMPARPGLLRHSGGAAIEVEVWAMSPVAFGTLVADIAAPLGIGRIDLDDGTQPSGFLVEAAAVAEAPDITQHGGWRAYMAEVTADT